MGKKIFVIGPVRNISPSMREVINNYVEQLEREGHQVYYPTRDTPQQDPTGLQICQDNYNGIAQSDEVHIAWDGKSPGCLFDLGMTFAQQKKIVPIPKLFPPATSHKSFASMVRAWAKERG